MKRRGVTVLIGAIVVAGLFQLMAIAPVPYAEFVPGPTYDTLGKDPASGKDVIEVTGATPRKVTGQLRFLTVGAIPDLTLVQAIAGWWDGDKAVIPRELVIPPGETQQQVDKANAQDFATSQSAASTAADIELGYPLVVTVTATEKGLPADGQLQPGDVIVSVSGEKIDSIGRLQRAVQTPKVGSSLTFVVTRAGQPVTVTLASVAGDQNVPRVGITTDAKPTAPFKFTVPIADVGGPSAGLLLTLGMIAKIDPTDITGGKIIAGTGTMDDLGDVGPIGGIPQKILGAKGAGAQWFLTPDQNCAEAVANQVPGMPLVRVTDLNSALAALAKIRAGELPELCPGAAH
jgi:PDZ domain-containing protein